MRPAPVRSEPRIYDVYPLVVRAGTEAEITVRPQSEPARLVGPPRGVVHPLDGLPGQTGRVQPADTPFTLADGGLRFRASFPTEQEYAVLIYSGEAARPQAEFHLYALRADLFARWPYKGDPHMHTLRSDGQETPACVAAACRQVGLDFAAITDHGQYAPSLEAIAAFAGQPIDLRLFPGEEVHPPDNPVHMINFGGRFSINARFGEAAYRAEVRALADRLRATLPPGVDPYPLASCLWCFDQIRADGGLGIFCHPDWIFNARRDVPLALTDLLFEHQPFDALELIGGYYPFEFEANGLQVARYHDERARGKHLPIVGASDSHGVFNGELCGWYYTIAFAPTPDLPDLVDAIKTLYSVAVEAPPGHAPRAHGPRRLAQYAQFLIRTVFPLHDAVCAPEGQAMLDLVGDGRGAGDPAAADTLARLHGRVTALYHHLWGQPT